MAYLWVIPCRYDSFVHHVSDWLANLGTLGLPGADDEEADDEVDARRISERRSFRAESAKWTAETLSAALDGGKAVGKAASGALAPKGGGCLCLVM